MKNSVLLIGFIFIFYNVLGQSDFQSILESEIVKNKITFQVIGGNLNVSIDNQVPKPLKSGLSLQGRRKQIIFNTKFIHPLKYQISMDNKLVDDELTKAAQEYYASLSNYIGSLNKTTSSLNERRVAARSSSNQNIDSVYISNPTLIELYFLLNGYDSNFFTSKGKVVLELSRRRTFLSRMSAIKDEEIQAKIINEYERIFKNILDINSYDEITSTIKTNKNILNNIEKMLTKILESHTNLENAANSFAQLYITTNNSVNRDNIIQLINNKIKEVKNKNRQFLLRKKELDAKYKGFTELLEKISNNTYEEIKQETRIDGITFQKAKRNEVTIYLKVFNYNEETKALIETEQKKYVIYLRKYQTFVPVVSSGVLYTNLSFRTFGTETNDSGEVILNEGKSKDNEIAVGAYLNLYLNNGWNNPIFFQLGVGPSREKPLLFTGMGIHLGSRISLSTGAVFTWTPTLDELKVGDIISGTTQIEDDIIYEFTNSPKFYLGLNFDLIK